MTGGVADIEVDVRIIASTNKDLKSAIANDQFRPDLYYRLKVVPLLIPPLRQRPEDIAPLAQYFIEKLAREIKREPPMISETTMVYLQAYSWPGNAREFRNVLERAIILEDAREILPEHLPREILDVSSAPRSSEPAVVLPPHGLYLEDVELDLIKQSLTRTGGNVSQAARLLGLSRDTLRYRLKKYHLEPRALITQ